MATISLPQSRGLVLIHNLKSSTKDMVCQSPLPLTPIDPTYNLPILIDHHLIILRLYLYARPEGHTKSDLHLFLLPLRHLLLMFP